MSTLDTGFQNYAKVKLPRLSPKSLQAVLELHGEGSTVPFIARYRKEKTGNLDEVEIRDIINHFEIWNELVKRKEFVLTEIAKQGALTDELKKLIEDSIHLNEIEELYRPYKKKKKTKAKIAMDAGLGPLADWIWGLGHGSVSDSVSLEVKAKEFLNPEAQFATYEECLRGAQHIIVEKLSGMPDLRAIVKREYFENGKIVSEKTKDFKPNSKYSMYAEFSEPVKTIQLLKSSHRYLALRRGWQEEELKVSITADDESLLKQFVGVAISNPGTQADEFLKEAAKHALTVHVIPSIVNELHSHLKDLADEHAISVFADNVRRVLMGSPFGPKVVLGIDPGIRTGCKVALIDKSSRFVTHTVMHMQTDEHKEQAKKLFSETLNQIQIDAIAVGNGTAGRETESFVRQILKDIGKEIPVVLVNEAGASVYSASDVAREEFPDLDVTVRGAISIARRLQDPLAELVKIEPKSIGVGQYQHDVNQSALKKSLHGVVESCVNAVGVDLNTASVSLLQYVAGIGPATAKNIVQYRGEKGLFQERSELLKVPHLSSKAYEQAAGFLRIPGGKVPLDATGVHPERYQAVRDMLQEAGVQLSQIMGQPSAVSSLQGLKEKWAKLIGEFTFEDILNELSKPGRDPRDPYKVFKFRDDIHEIKDLQAGMICPGIVTNVTNFGAFVDIGVHQDGLVHLSQLSHEFISDPRTVVNPGDQVTVKVLGVDKDKNQISLTMKLEERAKPEPKPRREMRRQDGEGRRPRPAGRGQRPGGKRRDERPERQAVPQRPSSDPYENRKYRHELVDERFGGGSDKRDHEFRRPRPDRPRRDEHTDDQAQPQKVSHESAGIMAARARREKQLKGVGRPQQSNKPTGILSNPGGHKRVEKPAETVAANAAVEGQKPHQQKPRPMTPPPQKRPSQPFNNPFAALTDLKKK